MGSISVNAREGEIASRMKLLVWMLALVSVSVTSATKIPLTKCCERSDDVYDVDVQKCVASESETEASQWPPVVYSLGRQEPMNWTGPWARSFHVTHDVTECGHGQVAESRTNFTLYEDGSVRTAEGVVRSSGQFCVDALARSAGVEFAVRYCAADPCTGGGVCVRKCCPRGHALNGETCQPSSHPFVVPFHNETGHLVLAIDEYNIRAGIQPDCPDGALMLTPFLYEEDTFYLLPSGQLYVPAYPERARYIDNYCVEDLFENFAYERGALVCAVSSASPDEEVVMAVFPYLMFVSAAFLVATFVVYAITPEIRNTNGATVMCHTASLATTYVCLGVIQLNPLLSDSACIGLAVVTHFSFVASFTWLNVMSFDIWSRITDMRQRSIQSRRSVSTRFVWYSLYAWSVPLIIVVVGQILDNVAGLPESVLRPQFGLYKCWFSDRTTILAYVYGPVAAILLCNIIFFVHTALRLYQGQRNRAFATSNQQDKQNYVVILSLFVLMGVSWVTEVVTWSIVGSTYYAMPTDILNILTGVFIFVIFVGKRSVRRLLRKRFGPPGRAGLSSVTMSASSSRIHGDVNVSSAPATKSTEIESMIRTTGDK